MLRPETEELLPLQLRNLLSGGKRFRHWLPVHLGKLWFVIKSLQVRRTPCHREPNHSPDFWRHMGLFHDTAP
jgi:hypothetical protein